VLLGDPAPDRDEVDDEVAVEALVEADSEGSEVADEVAADASVAGPVALAVMDELVTAGLGGKSVALR